MNPVNYIFQCRMEDVNSKGKMSSVLHFLFLFIMGENERQKMSVWRIIKRSAEFLCLIVYVCYNEDERRDEFMKSNARLA